MATHQQIAENFVNEKPNRRYKGTVEWRGNLMFCDLGKVYSYGYHYIIATQTDLYLEDRRVYFVNTESGYEYGRFTGTESHKWYVHKAIRDSNGIMICFNFAQSELLNLQPSRLGSSNIVDVNEYGEAVLEYGLVNNYYLVVGGYIVLLKGKHESIESAKASLIPKHDVPEKFSTKLNPDDDIKIKAWKNYYFIDTGLDDKGFARMKGLTQKQVNKWTRKGVVEKPDDVGAWQQIKGRIFGNSEVADLFGMRSSSPYITGLICDNKKRASSIFKADTWWKVYPMECNGYVDN